MDVLLVLLRVRGPAAGAHVQQLLAQGSGVGDGLRRLPLVADLAQQRLGRVGRQRRQVGLAHGGGMQAHAGADARGHLHRAGAFQFLDIDHAQARGHGQMHGFAGFVAQRAQGVARGRTQARAAPAAAGQLHQAMAQRPAAGRADLHQQPLGSQRRHDPVHGGTRKAGGLGDLGDAHGLGIVRHPLQHAHELGKRGGARDAIVGGVGSGSGRGGRHARNLCIRARLRPRG